MRGIRVGVGEEHDPFSFEGSLGYGQRGRSRKRDR